MEEGREEGGRAGRNEGKKEESVQNNERDWKYGHIAHTRTH